MYLFKYLFCLHVMSALRIINVRVKSEKKPFFIIFYDVGMRIDYNVFYDLTIKRHKTQVIYHLMNVFPNINAIEN